MTYPAAPWRLQGFAIQTVHPIDCDRARAFIPPSFEIMSIFPGKTVGGVYFSSYQSGSVLEYSELIVIPGVVHYQDKIGIWVSHIYVDHPDSVAGGRDIWGLPKELAQFTWVEGDRNTIKHVSVRQQEQLLCTLECDWRIPLWRQPLMGAALSQRQQQVLFFMPKASATLALIGSKLAVPSNSPFASLDLPHPWLTGFADALELEVEQPQAIGMV